MISSDKNLKPFLLCYCQQFTICEGAPAELESCCDLMRVKAFAQRYRRALIKEYTHSDNLGRSQAFRCVVEDRPHLLSGDAWEPLDELGDLRPIFEIFKKSGNRNPCAAKYPRAAGTLGVTLDRRTRRPIQHGFILTWLS